MDPSRKRAIRLTVALTAALLLATALIYVSFNAGREELTASQLLTRARQGQTYILAGTVLPGFQRAGCIFHLPGHVGIFLHGLHTLALAVEE